MEGVALDLEDHGTPACSGEIRRVHVKDNLMCIGELAQVTQRVTQPTSPAFTQDSMII
jgi:hypothetical protein